MLSDVIALESAVWEALVAGDPVADAAMLSDDFLGVYPTGFSDREGHAGQLSLGPTVATYTIVAPTLRQYSDDLVLLAYQADYTRRDGEPVETMYISSLWQRRGDGWINVFSQDTPAS